jgi:hypothetical protein
LSVIETVAARFPVTVGLNVTEIVQLFNGRTELPQVLVCAKSPGLAPAIVSAVIVIAVPPLAFVNVITCGVLVVPTVCAAKVSFFGEIEAAVPVPLRAAV